MELWPASAWIATESKLGQVHRAMASWPHLGRDRVAVKGKSIEVYEPRTPEPRASSPKAAEAFDRRHATYDAVMRFTLVDASRRHFSAERRCYRSWHEGWLPQPSAPLPEPLKAFIHHLGTPSFFDLCTA